MDMFWFTLCGFVICHPFSLLESYEKLLFGHQKLFGSGKGIKFALGLPNT